MSRIIEICGAPGSGKTTTYNALTAKWKKEANWSPLVYPLIQVDYTSPKKFLSTILPAIRKKKDFSALDAAGERFVSQFTGYMDQFWKSSFFKADPSYRGADLRFRNINVYWSTLRRIQYQRELPSKKVYIACEGLIQRIGNGWYKGGGYANHTAEAKLLIDRMPLPEAVVYLEVDIESNVKRIQTRKKMLPAHKAMSAEELAQVTLNNQNHWQFICSLLESKGIPVLRLNSGDDVPENAKKIAAFADLIFDSTAAASKVLLSESSHSGTTAARPV